MNKLKALIIISMIFLSSCGISVNIPNGATLTPSATQDAALTITETPQQEQVTPIPSIHGRDGIVRAYPDGLHLRTQPSTFGSVIVVIPDGSRVNLYALIVNSDGQGWWYLEWNGYAGYSNAEYISIEK